MPTSSIRCSCPHCGGRLGVKESFAGRRIKCPKCQEPFVVEAHDEEAAEAPPVSARKPMRPREDEEEDRPRKKKKKRQKTSSAIPWILIGGGVALVAVAVIVLVVVLKKSDSSKKGKDGSDPVAKKPDDKPVEKPIVNPDLAVNINGPWQEAPAIPGVNLAPDTIVTMHIVLVGDSFKISKMAVGETEKLIRDKLLALAGPGVGQVSASDDAPDGNSRLISMRLGPVKESAEDFAKKIDFGTVRSVDNGVITLVVRKEELSSSAPDPLANMPMPNLPNPVAPMPNLPMANMPMPMPMSVKPMPISP